jgi:hypothetical protein
LTSYIKPVEQTPIGGGGEVIGNKKESSKPWKMIKVEMQPMLVSSNSVID